MPQWRELDIEDLQPIEEVLAKIAALERLFQIAIGRRNHTHVCLQRARRSESLELALLQDTKKLGLRGCAHLGDFVEKGHSARRQLDLPGLGLLRARNVIDPLVFFCLLVISYYYFNKSQSLETTATSDEAARRMRRPA